VTWVGVLPTHRRRGLLTSLMTQLLGDLHERGEAVAALWASEGAIYQRFGYGPAAWDIAMTIPSRAPFTRTVTTDGVALAAPDAAVLAPIHERVAATTPGWFARDDAWWSYRLFDPESRRSGASPLRCVLAGDDGYALYSTKQEWSNGGSSSTVHVRELVASNPEVRARLWRYLLDLDLMKTVKTHLTAVDEPLLHLLAEPRATVPVLKDNLWVRLVDVAAALSARSYATDVDVVLEVSDETCPWNAGRLRLTGGLDGATCTATTDEAEVAVRATDLGAAYLGGTTLTSRAAAGHVTELRPGALAHASTAFGWAGPAPYCPMVF
jgi:predicted acetyltransferase